MGRRRAAGSAVMVLLALVLAACGGGGGGKGKTGAAALRDPGAVGAEEIVRQLARGAGGDATVACRTLTLATRRVVGRLNKDGGGCTKGLSSFISTYGLNPQLQQAKSFDAKLDGQRAAVTVDTLDDPLTAVRTDQTWRVSLVALPGVRGDLAAADACGRYLTKADALGIPSGDRPTLAADLAGQARLLSGFRQRLRKLPKGGPSRPGLSSVIQRLTQGRSRLLSAASKIRAGKRIYSGMVAGPNIDRVIRLTLRASDRARLGCPKGADEADSLAPLTVNVGKSCTKAVKVFTRLNRLGEPDSLPELQQRLSAYQDGLRPVQRIYGRLGFPAKLKATPKQLPKALRPIYAAGREGIADIFDILDQLKTIDGLRRYDELSVEGDIAAGKADAAFARLGIVCEIPDSIGRGGGGGGRKASPSLPSGTRED